MEAREMSGRNPERQLPGAWHPAAIPPDGEISTEENENSFEHLWRINGQMFRKEKAQRLSLDIAEWEIHRHLHHCMRYPKRNPRRRFR